MAVVRCPQGHYYDDEKFSHCPHCGIFAGQQNPEGTGVPAGQDRKGNGSQPASARRRGLFGWLDREQTVAFPSAGGGKGRSAGEKETAAPAGFWSGEGSDRTIALESEEDDGEGKTIGLYAGSKGNDYVTGWLVCTRGPEKGRDYRLHHGFNRVGRGLEMDVQIMEDPAVSRGCHCSVVYDGKSNAFSLLPGSGTLTYWWGSLLTEARQLEEGDEITVGGSCLVLIPFCREGRVWDEDEERNG